MTQGLNGEDDVEFRPELVQARCIACQKLNVVVASFGRVARGDFGVPGEQVDAGEGDVGHEIGEVEGAEASAAPDVEHAFGIRRLPEDVSGLERQAAVGADGMTEVELGVQARAFEEAQELVVAVGGVLVVAEDVGVGVRGGEDLRHVVRPADVGEVLCREVRSQARAAGRGRRAAGAGGGGRYLGQGCVVELARRGFAQQDGRTCREHGPQDESGGGADAARADGQVEGGSVQSKRVAGTR